MSRRYELRVLDMLRNYREVAHKVKEIVRRLDPDAEVYLFGSVPRGEYTESSDIDVLVVTEKLDLKDRMRLEVYRSVEAPVELHVVSRKQLEKWYKRFIREEELEKI